MYRSEEASAKWTDEKKKMPKVRLTVLRNQKKQLGQPQKQLTFGRAKNVHPNASTEKEVNTLSVNLRLERGTGLDEQAQNVQIV
jgi:hypothetical protein